MPPPKSKPSSTQQHHKIKNHYQPYQGEIVKKQVLTDGKTDIQYKDGTRVLIFTNGTRKEIYKNGDVIVYFHNGDVRQTIQATQTSIYYYASTDTKHTTYYDKSELIEFPSGQVEKHYPNGKKEVIFPDGSKKIIDSDGTVECIYSDS